MNQNKKPGWKERLSNWTTEDLLEFALLFQLIAVVFQAAAIIVTVARLLQ